MCATGWQMKSMLLFENFYDICTAHNHRFMYVTYTHSHSLTHTHSHSLTHTHSHSLTLTHTHSHSLTHTHPLTLTTHITYSTTIYTTVQCTQLLIYRYIQWSSNTSFYIDRVDWLCAISVLYNESTTTLIQIRQQYMYTCIHVCMYTCIHIWRSRTVVYRHRSPQQNGVPFKYSAHTHLHTPTHTPTHTSKVKYIVLSMMPTQQYKNKCTLVKL